LSLSLSLPPSCKWRHIAGLSAGSSGRPRRRVWPASRPTALQACATGLSPGGGGRRYPRSKAHGRQRSRAPPTSAIRAKQTENTLGDLVYNGQREPGQAAAVWRSHGTAEAGLALVATAASRAGCSEDGQLETHRQGQHRPPARAPVAAGEERRGWRDTTARDSVAALPFFFFPNWFSGAGDGVIRSCKWHLQG
ncbi:unnamed protein product, partial [Urochloa humidicola]